MTGQAGMDRAGCGADVRCGTDSGTRVPVSRTAGRTMRIACAMPKGLNIKVLCCKEKSGPLSMVPVWRLRVRHVGRSALRRMSTSRDVGLGAMAPNGRRAFWSSSDVRCLARKRGGSTEVATS